MSDNNVMTVERLQFVLSTFGKNLPVTMDPQRGLIIRGGGIHTIAIERDKPARDIDDDAAKLLGLPPHGAMNPCCGDGYFANDCKATWGEIDFDRACSRAREKHKVGMAAYNRAVEISD